MGVITAVVLAALAVYIISMVMGRIPTNFEWVLFLCTAVTFAYWLTDKFYFARRRRAAFDRAVAGGLERSKAERELLMQPWWLEYTASFFPVVLLVFVLRSFLFEPFRIPSDSMVPTLHDGDLILVKKYEYALRLPITYTKLLQTGTPQRGDVIVFRYPLNTTQDYIKRIVGLPGDTIEYSPDRTLSINGKQVPTSPQDPYVYESREQISRCKGLGEEAQKSEWCKPPQFPQASEQLDRGPHRIIYGRMPMELQRLIDHTHPKACTYGSERNSLKCVVPAGHYFVMGDNRDNSQDSRIWGFVPEENIKGRAFFIWMNFGNIGRVGSFN